MSLDKSTFYGFASSTISVTDVLNGSTVEINVPTKNIMVTDESDLVNLSEYPAGSIAYTAGFGAMWQKAADGEWVNMIGGGD